WWRHAIIVIVVLAATITPSGDPISLVALAVPRIFLYFVSIGVGRLIERSRAKKAPAA
ncbi:MAG: twin-arginine translocase subunit TatC, partial [Actinobacteria bacterium]|nr:twin-arginine translocase subunit TatC [Actinomycetota bacterium]